MAPLVRRSILKKFLTVVCCLPICILTPLALAQHPARTAGGVIHMPPPPILHVPISPAPMIHAPISVPRIWAVPSAGALRTGGFRPPRRPIRPFPPVLVVYESLFLFGGAFWGLNSCWWATCELSWPWTLGYATVSSPSLTSYVS